MARRGHQIVGAEPEGSGSGLTESSCRIERGGHGGEHAGSGRVGGAARDEDGRAEDHVPRGAAQALQVGDCSHKATAQLQSYMQKLEIMQTALLHFQGDGKGAASPSGVLALGGKGGEAASPQLTKTPVLP